MIYALELLAETVKLSLRGLKERSNPHIRLALRLFRYARNDICSVAQ
jgi:hypothetical protein